MESEFKKQKHMRQVTFKKDYKAKNGIVRYKKDSVHYMHKDVAEIVKGYADIEEINWKKINGDAKKVHDKAVKEKESTT